ncbi:LexA family transcriptional regulator [Variovorax paradoxus]|uniref:LexA family transcriptional regulator n=1 Tax=Variovorax paradoxus TaxID=34073 RepID=UPI0029C683B5|nr:S24 family peptidase [Variovorax paradoxus]WPH22286.1 S24 family peptidase [Variovorax paradoxus]
MTARGVEISQLAKALGISYQAVKRLLEGKSKTFNAQNNEEAARFLNVSSRWLATGKGSMNPDAAEQDPPTMPAVPAPGVDSATGDLTIAQYDVSGGMDTRGKLSLEAEPPGIIKSWRVDREWLQLNVRSYTSLQNLCIVTGFGPSMKGMFNPGDPLLMDRGVNRVDHEGVYFFRVGDEGYIKILQRVPEFNGPGFIIRVISKNEDFPPYDISPKNPHLHIIGKILTVWKSEQF